MRGSEIIREECITNSVELTILMKCAVDNKIAFGDENEEPEDFKRENESKKKTKVKNKKKKD